MSDQKEDVRIERYVALGDSISIDEYPGLDWQETHGLASPVPGLGAASLLHRNHDEAWPGFRGRDLASRSPGLQLELLATDGGTTVDVLAQQLPRLEDGGEALTLLTLTVGGNDLLQLLASGQRPAALHADGILEDVERILDQLDRLFPAGRVLLGTVYDPSDGASSLMGMPLGPPERAVLDRLNSGIRRLASERDRVVLADIAAHFAGHGLAAKPPERWYWPHMIIEPSARGASEVRRVWLEALTLPRED